MLTTSSLRSLAAFNHVFTVADEVIDQLGDLAKDCRKPLINCKSYLNIAGDRSIKLIGCNSAD